MRTQPILEALKNSERRGHWILALPMLSLDGVHRYWEEMGLRFHHSDRVLSAIRAFVLAEEALTGDPNTKNYSRKVLSLTRILFRDLREAEGDRHRGDQAIFALWNWFQLACDEESKWHWMWRILLYHLPDVALAPWGLPREKAAAVAALAERFASGENQLDAELGHLKAQTRSDWDVARQGYYARDGIDADVIDNLTEALGRIQFDRFWAEVVNLLTLPEMDVLVRWGRHHAAEIEAWKDDEARKTDAILGHRALRVHDAIVPAECRVFH
jgi:hypothetical protein